MKINLRTGFKALLATIIICLWIDIFMLKSLSHDIEKFNIYLDSIHYQDSIDLQRLKKRLNQDSL